MIRPRRFVLRLCDCGVVRSREVHPTHFKRSASVCTTTGGWRRTTSRGRGRMRECLHRAGSARRRRARADACRANDLEADVLDGSFVPTTEPTKTCTRLSNAGWSSCSAIWAASCARGAAATTKSPPTFGSILRAEARVVAALVSRVCRPPSLDRAKRHIDTVAPGFTHLQHAQPVSFAHELLEACSCA